MGQAIGQVLPFAAGIAVNPLPIIAVVLLLATPRGRWTGSAFAAGWLFGLLILGVVVLVSPAGTEESGGPATWISTRSTCGSPSAKSRERYIVFLRSVATKAGSLSFAL